MQSKKRISGVQAYPGNSVSLKLNSSDTLTLSELGHTIW